MKRGVPPFTLTGGSEEQHSLDGLLGNSLAVQVGEAQRVRDALPQQLLRTPQPPDHVVRHADVLGEDHVRHQRLLVPVVLLVGSRKHSKVPGGVGVGT